MDILKLQIKVRNWTFLPNFIKRKILSWLARLSLKSRQSTVIPAQPAVAVKEVVDADLPFYAVSKNISDGHFLGGTFVVRNTKTQRVVVCQANRSGDLKQRFPTGYEIVRSDVAACDPPWKEAYSVAPGTAERTAKNPVFVIGKGSINFGPFETELKEKREQ